MTRRDGIFESERAGQTPKVEHGPSQTAGPQKPAGGKVSRGDYEGKTPSSERDGR